MSVRGSVVVVMLSASACGPQPAPVAPPPTPEPPHVETLHAGVGLSDLPLAATRQAVVARYGAPTKIVPHGSYSVELVYEAGLSAFYCQADPSERVFVFSFKPPFRARTPRGIVLGESTARDVRKAYGDSGEWSTSDKSKYWRLGYAAQGFGFVVERDLSVPQFPLDEERHLGRTIVAIEVTFPGTFQCGDTAFPENYAPPAD
ncbi:MAG: hypothetical protein IPJ34_02745 [Myxococcales bacterium]|nr:hypothetical protein [Myxococcales bacterium]